MGKRVALLFIVCLIVLSLLIVEAEPASAELPKPSVPEFTVKLINYSVIEVTIKNQPEHVINYNIRFKRQFSEYWTELYHSSQSPDTLSEYPRQSQSDYTVLSFSVSDPAGDEMDVQVEAIIEWWDRPALAISMFAPSVYHQVTSGWSSTQTVTLPTPSPTPRPVPSALVGTSLGVVVVAVVLGAVLLSIYKSKKPKQSQAKLSQWQ